MRSIPRRLALLALAVLLAACGDAEDPAKNPDDKPPTDPGPGGATPTRTGDATFRITNAVYGLDNGDYAAKTYTSCRKDLASGLLTVSLGDATAGLELRVKDFKTAAAAYTCRQAPNNGVELPQLGDKFLGCMVDVRNAVAGGQGASAYSMHRGATTVPLFAYNGTCTINVTEVSDRLRGTISCGAMVQTMLEAAGRNPVDNGVVADVTGEFSCDFVKQ